MHIYMDASALVKRYSQDGPRPCSVPAKHCMFLFLYLGVLASWRFLIKKEVIETLHVIWEASTKEEWIDKTEWIP